MAGRGAGKKKESPLDDHNVSKQRGSRMTKKVNEGFEWLFKHEMKVALPLRLPQALIADSYGDYAGRKVPVLVCSAAAQADAMLVQADISRLGSLPLGYFMAGFWGHGANSYAFYWCEVTPLLRVFYRLPYGGVYSDVDEDRRLVVQFLTNWNVFVASRIPAYVRSVVAYDSMDRASWEFTMADSTKASIDSSAHRTGDFEALLAQAQAGGSR
jgi:hypothetical protein